MKKRIVSSKEIAAHPNRSLLPSDYICRGGACENKPTGPDGLCDGCRALAAPNRICQFCAKPIEGESVSIRRGEAHVECVWKRIKGNR